MKDNQLRITKIKETFKIAKKMNNKVYDIKKHIRKTEKEKLVSPV